MAAAPEKTDTNEKSEKLSIPERLIESIQKNRKALLVGFIVIIAVLAALIIGFTVKDKVLAKAYSQIDAFDVRYDDLKTYIGGEDSSKQAEVAALLEELSLFAAKKSGFASARAYTLCANIYADQKKWSEAENAWSMAAKKAAKSYLEPFSLYNAAIAAEELGKIDTAIGYYKQALDFENGFIFAAKAQFSIGRLEESRNKKDAALEAYRNLVSKWPGDQVWANLAQSRIIVLLD